MVQKQEIRQSCTRMTYHPFLFHIFFPFLCTCELLCTFQISVDFYYVPVGGRGGGRGGVEKGRGLERGGQNVYCMGTVSELTVPIQLVTHTVSVLTVPAIFSFVVRRIVHCSTGPLTAVIAGQLAMLACLNPCHIKPYRSWQDSNLQSYDSQSDALSIAPQDL